jgi:hypothetical protein
MREALAERDIGGVYRLHQRYGVSQRAIAAMTQRPQAEVSDIVAGRRRVYAYRVLFRVADGLGVQRGRMGLAFDNEAESDGPP